MKRSEIIHILREPVQSVMESFNKDEIDIHFPSKVMAYCIYLYENGKITDTDITDKNNPIGFLNPSSNSMHEYNSLVECLYDFALDSSTDEEFTDQVYKSIVKANNLNRFDKEELYKREGNIIDVPDTEPSVDLYTVEDKNGTEVLKTSSKDEAMDKKKEVLGTVKNSRGVVINGVEKSKASASTVHTQLKAGSKIICNNLNMYYKVNDKRPGRIISGDYYLYDGKVVNGRYAICIKPELALNNSRVVLGFVNVKDLDK